MKFKKKTVIEWLFRERFVHSWLSIYCLTDKELDDILIITVNNPGL